MRAKRATIVVVAHSSAFDEKMSVRIRAMCDGNLNLRVENIGDKLMNALEVRKILNAERSTGNVVFFEVEPGMGIRPNPFSRAKV
jgi:flagellar protein FlaH